LTTQKTLAQVPGLNWRQFPPSATAITYNEICGLSQFCGIS
jgi:hypothetical protein